MALLEDMSDSLLSIAQCQTEHILVYSFNCFKSIIEYFPFNNLFDNFLLNELKFQVPIFSFSIINLDTFMIMIFMGSWLFTVHKIFSYKKRNKSNLYLVDMSCKTCPNRDSQNSFCTLLIIF